MLLTRKMKKTTVWTLCLRLALVCSRGLIRSMLAPVVPMKLAMAVPISRMVVFVSGVPLRSPLTLIPPLMTYSENSSTMNGTYSPGMA